MFKVHHVIPVSSHVTMVCVLMQLGFVMTKTTAEIGVMSLIVVSRPVVIIHLMILYVVSSYLSEVYYCSFISSSFWYKKVPIN